MNQLEKDKKPQFLRKLNLLDSTSLVIGAVIGSGIFMTAGFIAEYLPSPGLMLIVWLVGGLITISGALSFAELGAMFPKAGGQYIYIREAYGPWAGFFFGWGFFWFIMCGGIATLGVAFAEFVGYFIPSLSTQSYILQLNVFGFSYSLSAGQLVAVASILILSGVNYFGIKTGVIVQNIFTFLRIAAIAAFVILGLTIGKKAGITNFGQIFSVETGLSFDTLMSLFGLALIAVFWTYDGWYSPTCTAEEIKKPERNLPLSLILGTLGITIIYLLMNLVYIMALPIDKMKGVTRIGELASTQLFGPTATHFFSAAIMISIFGCLSATIIYGPRVYYAMAKDRSFFKSMAYIHPRYRVPSKALVGQAIWSSLLCLSGTYKDLFEYVVFALVIFFALTGFAVIILRFKQPDRKRPYKTWGYPVIPLFFVIINLAVFFNIVINQPLKSTIGLIMLGIGIPAFLYWKKKARKDIM
ncbi:MAG: amino acid permease [Candidatus Aminicenantes bacterium]|nr:MAG: amino acid permease [Candidatus Aminicenantes bacterium]